VTEPTFLDDPRIVPAIILELPGMYEQGRPVPDDPREVQELFRAAAHGSPLAGVPFIPHSDLLLPIPLLLPHVGYLAEVCSRGVDDVGSAELAGGYAFLNSGEYLFGVEDDSTLHDTARWEEAARTVAEGGRARVRHACDQFISIVPADDRIVLVHERTAQTYSLGVEAFQAGIAEASQQLREFAHRFVPLYERSLARTMPPDRAHLAAYDNFSNRSGWFSSIDAR
jgi:hypothetical protein